MKSDQVIGDHAEPGEQTRQPAPRAPYPSPPPIPKRGRLMRVIIWVSILLVFGYAFYFVITRQVAAPKGPGARRGFSGPVPVTTASAQKGNIGVYIDAIGTVTPVYTASIFSQVSGIVVAVKYQEGQLVKKGDPLVEIDARPFEATLLQAQGLLDRDTHVLGQAQMDLDRYRAAWARNAVSKQILEDQDKLVLQDQGTVKNDQGTVQYDQIQVDYCHIKAPIDGRVGLRLVDPGNLVSATTTSSSGASPLVVVTQIQPITVVFTMPEDRLGEVQAQMRKGAKLVVDVFDRSAQNKIATGEVQALDNQIDTTTGTVRARAGFSNDDFALFPNQFVNTRLLVETLEGVTLIPSAAVQQNGSTFFVYVIHDETAHVQNVKPGVTDGGLTQVEGINPGDVIANSSFEKLQDGSKVNLAAASGKPSGAGAHGGKGGEGHSGHKHDGKEQ